MASGAQQQSSKRLRRRNVKARLVRRSRLKDCTIARRRGVACLLLDDLPEERFIYCRK